MASCSRLVEDDMTTIQVRDGYRQYTITVYIAGTVMAAAGILIGAGLGYGHLLDTAAAAILAAAPVLLLVHSEIWPRLRAGRDGTFELRRELLGLVAHQDTCTVQLDRDARILVGVEPVKRMLARQWIFSLIDEEQVLTANRSGAKVPVTATCYRISSDSPAVLRREAAAFITVSGNALEVENILSKPTRREVRDRKRAGLLYATADELQVLIRHLKAAEVLDSGEE